MAEFTSKDMKEYLELYKESWAKNDMVTINEIVSQFVADARIHQVARFSVQIHVFVSDTACVYFCDRLAKFV